MNTTERERSFLEMLRQQPRDHDVRAVYADWLEEQGETERTEFVHLWLRVRLEPEQLTDLNAIKQRIEELRANLDEAWLDAVEPSVFEDAFLGRVQWEEIGWSFEAGPIAGRSIQGNIFPEFNRVLPDEEWLRYIRACVQWVREHEPELRVRVAEDMFPYWIETYYDEDEDDIEDSEEFARAISLHGIGFSEGGKARIYFDDANLFGGHGIWVEIEADGRFADSPDFA